MRSNSAVLLMLFALPVQAASPVASPAVQADPVAVLVARLDLESYKATIKALTQFGDRRQGTDRNRAAVNWIEARLRSYGCLNTARIKYDYYPNQARQPSGPPPAPVPDPASGGARYRGVHAAVGVNSDPLQQPDEKLRALNYQPCVGGVREEVYC